MTAAFNLSQLANNLNTSGQLDATDGLTGLLPIANGGTNANTAATAFSNIKQAASTTATGVVELATGAEATAGTDTSRVITPSTLRSGLNATGSAPVYAPRAWVNFNGTGTVAIRASGNVSSITDNGTGDYTVNFTTAMPDANYAVCCNGLINLSTNAAWVTRNGSPFLASTTQCEFRTKDVTNNTTDALYVDVSIFR